MEVAKLEESGHLLRDVSFSLPRGYLLRWRASLLRRRMRLGTGVGVECCYAVYCLFIFDV